MELFKVIAMMCALSVGDNPEIGTMEKKVSHEQARCHAYYARCLRKKRWKSYSDAALMVCMRKRVQVKRRKKSTVKAKKK